MVRNKFKEAHVIFGLKKEKLSKDKHLKWDIVENLYYIGNMLSGFEKLAEIEIWIKNIYRHISCLFFKALYIEHDEVFL